MDQITGYIENIVFSSESGFCVAKLKESHKSELTPIVGILSSVQPGETLQLEGHWKMHPSYGKQFEVASFIVRSPSDLLGIQKYLESGLVKGIGPVYAEKIVKKFGLETLQVIDATPKRLLEVAGIGKKRIEEIKKCWDEQKTIREVIIFLRSFEISPTYAQKIFKKYENQAIEKVKENPYQLAKDIIGIGFKIADTIASKLGFTKDSPKRLEAGVEFSLYELSNNGHSCYPKEKLLEYSGKILETQTELISPIIEKMILDKAIISEKILFQEKKQEFIWLKSLYYYEKAIAKELFRLKNSPSALRYVDANKAMTWVQNKLHIQLAKNQQEALCLSVQEKVHIITGGPGTGKSTITKAILTILEKITDKILLCAPTGRAAKRLSQITRKKAFTIHSLLEFDFAKMGFKRDQENPLKCHLIIIDEASMIDTLLMYHLLKAIPDTARVILIGDIDQLPSIGPGYVLKDIIASKTLSITHLDEIFRQAKGSKIITNAHRINKGFLPSFTYEEKDDFQFLEMQDPNEIQEKIVSLVSEEIPKKKLFHSIREIQVLSPMKKGVIGTENLNHLLQNSLNPSNKPFFRAGMRLHIGDKVMQRRNNYNKHVYNGDVGYISQIDLSEQCVIVMFDERPVEYDFSELDEIILAYCVSVHKYQGSECRCIIIPIHTTHFKLLYRNLLYTAITRGKKYVVLVGTKKAVAICVKNNEVQKRFTALEHFLRKIDELQNTLF